MNNFFEVNLPQQAPSYLVGQALRDNFEAAVRNITHRTQVLNDALAMSFMEPNKFHELAKWLFDFNPEFFDSYSAADLANLVVSLDDGEPVAVKRLEFRNTTVLFDAAFTTTKEWESLRHVGIGGSESSTVMGVSHWQSLRGLYHEKIGTAMTESNENDPVFERGHLVEPKVIEAFCKANGAVRVPESRMFASKKYPNSTANIDGIVRMPNGKLYVFEAKTSKEGNRISWVNGKVPRYYLTQAHQYPAVLDDDRIEGTYISCIFVVDYINQGYFITASYDELSPITNFVERDKDVEEEILQAEADFWNGNILTGIEPEISGDPAVEKQVIEALNGPANDPTPVELTSRLGSAFEEWQELDTQRKSLEAKAKALKKREDELEAEFLDKMGGHAEGYMLIDGTDELFWTAKKTRNGTLAVNEKDLAAFYPDAYAVYQPEAEKFRTFETLRTLFPDAFNAVCYQKGASTSLEVKRVTKAEYDRKHAPVPAKKGRGKKK